MSAVARKTKKNWRREGEKEAEKLDAVSELVALTELDAGKVPPGEPVAGQSQMHRRARAVEIQSAARRW